jgi:hypothetical protein
LAAPDFFVTPKEIPTHFLIRRFCQPAFHSEFLMALGMRVRKVVEEEIIVFIRECVGSVHALELLLLLKRRSPRAWHTVDLIRELRSSATAVAEALSRLTQSGLVTEMPAGRYIFAPSTPEDARLAAEIEKAYVSAPMSVMKAIVTAPAVLNVEDETR